VGAGPSGLFAALELAARGRDVEVVDDDLRWGGSAGALTGTPARPWKPLFEAVEGALRASRFSLRLRTTAAGIYGDDVLVADPHRIEVLSPRTLVVAAGAHDGVLAFEGNDLPGVLSGRAAGHLAAAGVSLGKRPVIVVPPGGGSFAPALRQSQPGAEVIAGTPLRVAGSSRPRAVAIATRKGERSLPCDILVVDAPRSPAYELCAQAGATLVHEASGYSVVTDGAGRIRSGVFACGEVAGTPLEPSVMAQRARTLAEAALSPGERLNPR
jgi:sarcosine oxidase subunit alpha